VPITDRSRRARKEQPSELRANVEIGENVWIGARASIIGNVRIGDGAIVGAGTVVTKDVPAYSICAGNPMRVLREIPQ
jgi:acetyltransferase-like isoleucine patch superfamily enzyme